MLKSKDLLEELRWRGLLNQASGNLQDVLSNPTSFYIGIDGTAPSLGVHHTIGLMAARIMQKYGHRPIILVGEATSSIGDPSGKSEERKAISKEAVAYNTQCIIKQIKKFLDFDSKDENAPIIVNNLDWMKDYTFLDFIRDIGKKITVNYLMAKENVKKRLERDGSGISFQEFSYGLIQGYDFVHLYKEYGCKVQIGGSDNLGNILTGTELIHKMLGKDDACAITWDLVTCADGRKFGKTEGNSVWLDREKTSPYEFYQFWINQSDVDSESFVKKFTLLPREEIESLIEQHRKEPFKRLLQKTLAEYMTRLVHSDKDFEMAVEASKILFGGASEETIKKMDENTVKSVFKDVPQFKVSRELLNNDVPFVDFAVDNNMFPSKGELRKLIKSGGISVNGAKIQKPNATISSTDLIANKYILVKKGKQNYYLTIAE